MHQYTVTHAQPVVISNGYTCAQSLTEASRLHNSIQILLFKSLTPQRYLKGIRFHLLGFAFSGSDSGLGLFSQNLWRCRQ